MSYNDGEALIETRIQALSSFPAGSVSRANFNIVDQGKAKTYAILVPGPFTHTEDTLGGGMGHRMLYLTTWTTVCQLWTVLGTSNTSMIDMQAKRQDIIETFDAWRKAGDSAGVIRNVIVQSGDDPKEIVPEGRIFPIMYRQDLNIVWQEENYATLQE